MLIVDLSSDVIGVYHNGVHVTSRVIGISCTQFHARILEI